MIDVRVIVKLRLAERFRLSVRPSVRLSHSGICVQTNEDTIMRFTASGRTIPLVSGKVKFIWIFTGDHPQRGRLSDAPLYRQRKFNQESAITWKRHKIGELNH